MQTNYAVPNFAKVLFQKNILSKDEIQIALIEQQKTSKHFGEVVMDLELVRSNLEVSFMQLMADEFGISIINLAVQELNISNITLDLVPESLARECNILPLKHVIEKKVIAFDVAINEPNNLLNIDHFKTTLESFIHKTVRLNLFLTNRNALLIALDRAYGFSLDVDEELSIFFKEIQHEEYQTNSRQHPVVILIEKILSNAYRQEASDIHFEPEKNVVNIRYRIDGILQLVKTVHKSYWSSMLIRLKIIANLDITETRLPQDSRFAMKILDTHLDFRVSSFPTEFGENIVVRILDKNTNLLALNQLGLDATTYNELKLMLSKPQGICIVTGPTGSGKTTTLYSILNEKNQFSVNIMSLEDPIEYSLHGIRQTNVQHAVGMSFEAGVRAILRQDPDIILIGEIRDQQTAQMALQAAMTGHQVYTTMHTNSALNIVARITTIGIKQELLAGNIMGIIGQRLIRLLCSHCKQARTSTKQENIILQQPTKKQLTLYSSQGCEHCNFTGYKHRMVLMEVLRFNKELDTMISQKADLTNYTSKNFVPLQQRGIQAVITGKTTIVELARVVDLTEI